MVAVTAAPALNEKPVGACNTKVPFEGTSLCVPSAAVGPVSTVQVAVPLVVLVSALIAPPPVAGVTITAACAADAPPNNAADIKKAAQAAATERLFIKKEDDFVMAAYAEVYHGARAP